MRERGHPGGSPRLPPLLQLNSPESIAHPMSAATSSYSPDRMKMRTRVAVRDKTPHRFQVVPLRDARFNANPLPAKDHSPGVKTYKMPLAATDTEIPLPARLRLRAAQSPYQPSTKRPPLGHQRNKTQERKPLVELDKNILGMVCPTLNLSPSLPTMEQPNIETSAIESPSPLPLDYRSSASEYSQYSQSFDDSCSDLCRLRSSLQSNGAQESYCHGSTSHFKSPSLGNILPNISSAPESEAAFRINTRISTISIGSLSDRRGRPYSNSDRQKTIGRDVSKRHAIYSRPPVPAESGHSVPATNIQSGQWDKPLVDVPPPGPQAAVHLDHSGGQGDREFDSQKADYMKDLLRSRLGLRSRISPSESFESQSSISSVYSQDALSLCSQAALIQTRPLTCYGRRSPGNKANIFKGSDDTIAHHPIITMLLQDVENLILEWSFIEA